MTTKISTFLLFKNAFANIIRGSFSALIAVILPPFLVRILPTDTFSVWVLILQLTTYVSYFDFGVQTAVGRFVAYTNELGNFRKRDQIINTSLAILSGSGFLAALFISLLTWHLSHIFPKIPGELLGDAKISIFLIGCSLAIGLPFSVFNGIFIGIQRYEIPAVITSLNKLTTALCIFILAQISGNLILMSAATAVLNIIFYLVQFLVNQKYEQNVNYHYKLISKDVAKEVTSYCFSLSILSFGMLLVSGLDTTIVGIFDFNAVAYYSIATSIITLIVGLQSAIFSVLLPVGAVMDAQDAGKQLGKLLVTTTRYGVFILLATGIPLILYAKPFLALWVGKEYAEHGAIILQCLVIANIIRLSGVPYATLAVSTAQQKLVINSALLEGLSNLITSLYLGSVIGSIGVAIGTIIGAVISIGGHIIYNIPRTRGIIVSQIKFIEDGLLRPLVCAIPLLLILIFNNFTNVFLIKMLLIICSIITTLLFVWNFGLLITERNLIRVKAKVYLKKYLNN